MTGPKPLDWHHGRRRQTIVETILSEVFQGRLAPGVHLVTQDLASRLGVSHTPIREALIFLAGIGVIDLLPNRGAVVRRITANEVREICQVRKILECEAVRAACGRIDKRQLVVLDAELRLLMGRKNRLGPEFVQAARELDSRLHDLIAECSGNAFLAQEIGRLKILFRAFRDAAWQRDQAHHDYERVHAEAREHLAIIEALLAEQSKQAAAAMARHIRSGVKYWSRAIAERTDSENATPKLR